MIEKFRAYFETLEGFSTAELDRSVEKLVHAERRNTALVIAHIAEMREEGELSSEGTRTRSTIACGG